MIFVADDQPSKVLQPTVGAFDFPSAAEAAQLATVLQRRTAAVLAMRADQIDAPAGQALPKWVASLSATQPTVVEQRFNQGDLGGKCAVDLHRQRRPLRVGQNPDLGSLAALGLADQCAPPFALANAPSAKASSTSTWPIPPSCLRPCSHALANNPAVVHPSHLRQQVAGEGNDFGKSFHRVPVRRIHKMPSKPPAHTRRGRPRKQIGDAKPLLFREFRLVAVLAALLYRAADGHQRNFNFIGVTPFNSKSHATGLPDLSISQNQVLKRALYPAVVETCRQQRRDTLQFLVDAANAHFHNRTPPLLTTNRM